MSEKFPFYRSHFVAKYGSVEQAKTLIDHPEQNVRQVLLARLYENKDPEYRSMFKRHLTHIFNEGNYHTTRDTLTNPYVTHAHMAIVRERFPVGGESQDMADAGLYNSHLHRTMDDLLKRRIHIEAE